MSEYSLFSLYGIQDITNYTSLKVSVGEPLQAVLSDASDSFTWTITVQGQVHSYRCIHVHVCVYIAHEYMYMCIHRGLVDIVPGLLSYLGGLVGYGAGYVSQRSWVRILCSTCSCLQ